MASLSNSNFQIDPQTTEIWPTELNVPLSVSDTLFLIIGVA